jgi:hypothetical protein
MRADADCRRPFDGKPDPGRVVPVLESIPFLDPGDGSRQADLFRCLAGDMLR